jgi:tetratricopeptide (TPR) repeat protein
MSKFWKLACVINIVLATSGCRDSGSIAIRKNGAEQEQTSTVIDSPTATETDHTAKADSPANPIDKIPQGKRYRLAVDALDRGDFAEGDRIRSELSADTQYNILAKAVAAIVFTKQNKFDEAIRIAEEISVVSVMQGESYVIAGEVFRRQNRLSEAIGAFESGLKLDSNHARTHRLLGATYYDTGAMRFATEHLRKAAELDPLDINSLMLSEKIFQDYEQYQDAILDCRALLTRTLSDDAKNFVRIKLAECLIEIRQLDQARSAIQDCPKTLRVSATLAAIEESAGNMSEAQKLAELVLDRVPNDRTTGLILGRILVVRRDWPAALLLLDRLTNSFPYDHESRLLLGRALLGSGEKDRGEQQIKQATELKDTFLKFTDLHQKAIKHPNDAALRVEIGRLAEQLGKLNLAKQWYRAAVGLDEQNAEAQSALERLKKATTQNDIDSTNSLPD